MKIDLCVQFGGEEKSYNSMVEQFKELWKSKGRKIRDIKNVNLYFNTNESRVYYVVNDNEKGNFNIS